MMSAESELRVWVATDGPEVIGVLPFVAEPMARGRMRLLPPTTNMMYGTVPIARADRGREIADAVVEDFAVHSEMVDLASIFWLPEGSPWAAAFQGRLGGPDWVATDAARYTSCATRIDAGIETWLHQRDREIQEGGPAPRASCRRAGFSTLHGRGLRGDHGMAPSLAVALPAAPRGSGWRGLRVRRQNGQRDRNGARPLGPGSFRALDSRTRRPGDRGDDGRDRRDHHELLDSGFRPRMVPARPRYRRSRGVTGRRRGVRDARSPTWEWATSPTRPTSGMRPLRWNPSRGAGLDWPVCWP